MSTSGSIDFTRTRSDLIAGALELCQAKDPAEDVSPELYSVANTTLNQYIKFLMVSAPMLWRQAEGVLFLTESQQSYVFGTDRACKETDFVSTTLSAAASAGASTITVASITGLASGDNIGIELSNGTRQWTTINGAPAGSTVTLTAVLTGAASIGASVFSYTTALEIPKRITSIRRRVAGYDTPVEIVGRQTYMEQPNKTASGKTVLAAYQPAVSSGTLYLWPTADSVADTIHFTYERTLEDMDNNDDTFDLPVEWLEVLEYGLAYRVALKLGNFEAVNVLKSLADEKYQMAMAYDQEVSSLFLQPA